MEQQKHILLGITGSISAYKSPLLARELIKRGYEVRVVMTSSAEKFVTPLTLQNLTKFPVTLNMFDESVQSGGSWHIQLARWCDAMIIAPCSANTICKMANGLCDNALTMLTLALPQETQLLFAPAMDTEMWIHPATQRNVRTLQNDGAILIPPEEGELASGLSGIGRLPEIETLVNAIEEALRTKSKNFPLVEIKNSQKILFKSENKENYEEIPTQIPLISTFELPTYSEKDKFTAELELLKAREAEKPIRSGALCGKNILITAGPTFEKLDDARFIGNFSSGKMGFALAAEAEMQGAEVTLITGHVALETPEGVERVDVESAQEMFDAVIKYAGSADIMILAAAVADFTPIAPQSGKIKKAEVGDKFSIELKRTPDILAALGKIKKSRQKLIGFALEATNELTNARKKLTEKNCDAIVLNSMNKPQSGFGGDDNTITILSKNGSVQEFPPMTKQECASEILRFIAEN